MQPLLEVVLTRPWHWGIAIASAPAAQIPDVSDSLVAASADALVVKVRHTQDVELEVFEGDSDWATATVRVRSLTALEEVDGLVHYDGTLHLPDGRLAIGDADGQVVIDQLSSTSLVRIYGPDAARYGTAEVSIDLAPRDANE